jgi:hypothetical protein
MTTLRTSRDTDMGMEDDITGALKKAHPENRMGL